MFTTIWARVPMTAVLLLTCISASALPTGDLDGLLQQLPPEAAERVAENRALLAEARFRQDIIDLMNLPGEAKPWPEYRKIFLTDDRIEGGVAFWNLHAQVLAQAEQEFGVDAAYVVAIIGVETVYGRVTGSHRVLDALATLAFFYPPRADFFRAELAAFFSLVREENVDPLTARGSYAGAMGWGQFMPSSYRRFAVDMDGDGQRDLWGSPADIIGSVAHYLREHGWQPGGAIVTPARQMDPDALPLEYQVETPYTVLDLVERGYSPLETLPRNEPVGLVTLASASGPMYYFSRVNFHAITRYNRSAKYAMAVHQLAQAIEHQRRDNAANS